MHCLWYIRIIQQLWEWPCNSRAFGLSTGGCWIQDQGVDLFKENSCG